MVQKLFHVFLFLIENEQQNQQVEVKIDQFDSIENSEDDPTKNEKRVQLNGKGWTGGPKKEQTR